MHMPHRGPPFVGAFPHSDPQRYSPDPTLTGELGKFQPPYLVSLSYTRGQKKSSRKIDKNDNFKLCTMPIIVKK